VNLTKGILTQCRMCRSQKSAIQIPGPGWKIRVTFNQASKYPCLKEKRKY
jgi:hypothetical protein